jgi:uncharacterized protein YjiS (DUF1127 family)
MSAELNPNPLAWIVRRLVAAQQRRETLRLIDRLDNRLLADIGATREELRAAMIQPASRPARIVAMAAFAGKL